MKIKTIDLETSIKNHDVGDFKASPFHPDNKIVAYGEKLGHKHVATLYMPTFPPPPACDILAGQNIKFDLLYLMRYKSWREWLKTGLIWDVQLAEFVLTGQEEKYASLDKMSKKYGGTIKPDKIKEYWDNGIDTEGIPKGELLVYLQGDVLNTYKILCAQILETNRRGLMSLMRIEMDSLLATTEMEWNGIFADKQELLIGQEAVQKELDELEKKLIERLQQEFDSRYWPELNLRSAEQLSIFLFGGYYSFFEYLPVIGEDNSPVLFKTGLKKGQIKTKKTETTLWTNGLGLTPAPDWAAKKAGVWFTNDDVLNKLRSQHKQHKELFNMLLKHRELTKDLNTYYIGYGALIWPHDNCIHGRIGHVGTNTSRFNSASPNMQNLSNKRLESK